MDNFVRVLKYFMIGIDPIHIGTGGYRLGSVDNTIVREPHTHIPKIPGSAISGVVKSYYPYISGSKEEWDCLISDGGCGKHDCIICYTYGFSKKEVSQKGRAQFFDTNIILFPIFTTLGTKWITTSNLLKDFFNIEVEEPNIDTAYILSSEKKGDFLAIGWLSLKLQNKNPVSSIVNNYKEMEYILSNIVVVNNDVFPFLINNNLEVRTSTSIDHETGTAKEGALFTYEAIPRSTVFATEISFFDYASFKESTRMNMAIERLEKSIDLLSVIGLGGMNTRGFGRIKAIKR